MAISEAFRKHRPGYHFLPPENWMNDPNGLIQFKGEYHLFYQHNPQGACWGNMTWGHAVSRDLIHWTHLPPALYPDKPYDKDGVFSGCAVDDGGVATILYTGVSPQTQCLATSRDMIRWDKYDGNPVISGPPKECDTGAFRDPFVWKENDTWYMVVGSSVKDVGGLIFLYRSSDLRTWEYLNPLCSGRKEETSDMWECPNFFPLGDKWVLIISPNPLARAIYFIGRYENFKFTPEYQDEMDLGGSFYAPQVFKDDQGRRIMIGWTFENRGLMSKIAEGWVAAGWAGVMTLPRVLTLGVDGRLRYAPVDEVNKLRGKHTQLSDVNLSSQDVDFAKGDSLEINIEFGRIAAEEIGLKVRCNPDGSEETLIAWDGRTLSVDRERSSVDPETWRDKKGTMLTLAEGENLHLRVFIDRSIVEIYANERACLTSRIYPSKAESLGVRLYAKNGCAEVRSSGVWKMNAVWSESTQK